MAQSQAHGAGPSGEEDLRFIRNFHDIFLSIGLLMFAGGVAVVSLLLLGEYVGEFEDSAWRRPAWALLVAGVVDAAIFWGLAEIFARARRLFLPAIVIMLAFQAFVAVALLSAHFLTIVEGGIEGFDLTIAELKLLPVWMLGGLSLSALVFYARMRLPFAMGAFGASLAATGVALSFFLHPEWTAGNHAQLQLAAGLFVFILAIIFDARDPERLTRYSDNAFWLHFFAAPTIYLSSMSLLTDTLGVNAGGAVWASAILILFAFFTMVSLLINRRALLVSGLATALVAIGILISRVGLSGAWTAALTLLVLGGSMVLLGGAWRSARRALVAPFPKTGWIARIVPPEPAAGKAENDAA